MKGLLIALAVMALLFFIPDLLDLFRWISARAKESQKIGEMSRKITELQRFDDRLQKEVEREIKNELKSK